MPSLAELVKTHSELDGDDVDHLQRLVAGWGLLADLCFADLLLYLPIAPPDRPGPMFLVIGQVRPTTSQTLFPADLVGAMVAAPDRPVVRRVFRSGEISEDTSPREGMVELVRAMAVPVRVGGRVVAVMCRESAPSVARRYGELENAYLHVFEQFARMIAQGKYPYPATEPGEDLPRVADGVLVLDSEGSLQFASPNGISALHRLGVVADTRGRRLPEMGLDDGVVRQAYATRAPATTEWAISAKTHVLAHCLPLLDRRGVEGGLLLLRDVSELRRLDRLLVTKDTHIREIHHRVKNNLQTISSLLRIQARRVEAADGRAAIEESVRRIGSIALVHEILSREAADDVPFGEIARPIIRMVDESLLTPDRGVSIKLVGPLPVLPSAVATPLALVLTELLQNVVDHAFGRGTVNGSVEVVFTESERWLELSVRDDGDGLSPGFTLDSGSGLGLSIVRTLVESELAGRLELRDRAQLGASGTAATVTIPRSWD
ncbi:MAG: PAS domain-containing sensor histidine kinase [Acidimicrobiia bacterium]|nr:PAS domain-containing sensor histidine kinase [Acidimicrobiia bacterium]